MSKDRVIRILNELLPKDVEVLWRELLWKYCKATYIIWQPTACEPITFVTIISDIRSMIAGGVVRLVSKDYFHFSISALIRLVFEKSHTLWLEIIINMRASPQGCFNKVTWSSYIPHLYRTDKPPDNPRLRTIWGPKKASGADWTFSRLRKRLSRRCGW